MYRQLIQSRSRRIDWLRQFGSAIFVVDRRCVSGIVLQTTITNNTETIAFIVKTFREYYTKLRLRNQTVAFDLRSMEPTAFTENSLEKPQI
jgi:hypothetical protein